MDLHSRQLHQRVRDENDPTRLHVRARSEGDIRGLWPQATVIATPHADYEFRASVPQAEVTRAVDAALAAIDYKTDFKGGVKDKRRHAVYLAIWQAARRLAHS